MLLALPTKNALTFYSFSEDFLNAYCVPDTVPSTDKTCSPLTGSADSRGEASQQASSYKVAWEVGIQVDTGHGAPSPILRVRKLSPEEVAMLSHPEGFMERLGFKLFSSFFPPRGPPPPGNHPRLSWCVSPHWRSTLHFTPASMSSVTGSSKELIQMVI